MLHLLNFTEHLLVYNVYFMIISLLSLNTSLYAEAINMKFTAEAKPTNTPLYNLFLDCNVTDTPTSVTLHKKHQPKVLEPYREFNLNKTAHQRVKLELTNQPIGNITGEYECSAIYTNKPRVTKIVNVNVHDMQPTFCEMTINDQVINVTGNKAVAEFCIASTKAIEKLSIDRHILFDKRVVSSDKYKLEILPRETQTNFTLHLLHVTRNSAGRHKVKIVDQTNFSLEFRFSLLFPKENPTLCEGTSNNTNIPTVTNMATIDLCVKPGENISTIMINNVHVFDHRMLPSSQYKILNKTDGEKIHFTIQMLNLTTTSPEKNVVKILTNSGLQLTYHVNIMYNPVTQVSTDCFDTENDKSQHVVNDTITLSLCVNKPQPITKVSVNGRSLDESISEPSTRYSIHNETRGDRIQLQIKISNLNRKAARNVSIDLTSTVENKTYYYDLAFPQESTYSASSSTQHMPIFISLIGTLMFTLCRC